MESKGRQRPSERRTANLADFDLKPSKQCSNGEQTYQIVTQSKPNTDTAVLCRVHRRLCEALQSHDPLHTPALTGQSSASAFPIYQEEKKTTKKRTTSIQVSSTFALGD